MSLIIEALKRARDDAVRRQAASRGLPLAPVPRMRGRSRWLSLALVPLAAALVVCILLLIDLYSKIPAASAPVETVAQATSVPDSIDDPNAVATPQTSGLSDPGQLVEKSPVELESKTRESNAAPANQVTPPPRTTRPRQETTPGIAEPASSPRPSGPEPVHQSQEGSPPGEERVFVGQAQLLDGQLVDLEGIAWSESEPFALLNGQVVGVGELIRAYRVTDIKRNQVVLEHDQDRIVLRLD